MPLSKRVKGPEKFYAKWCGNDEDHHEFDLWGLSFHASLVRVEPDLQDKDDPDYDPDLCQFKKEHGVNLDDEDKPWKEEQYIGLFVVSDVKPGGW